LARSTINKLLTDRVIRFKKKRKSSLDESSLKKVKNWSPISVYELDTTLNEAESLFIQKNYNSAISKISELMKRLEVTENLENKNEYLARIHFLWGAYYIESNNKISVANSHFDKVIEYNPKFEILNKNYNTGVKKGFEEYLSGKKEETPEHEETKKEITISNKDSIGNILLGKEVRVIKENAVLRLNPTDDSPIIKKLPLGAALKIKEIRGNWIKVELPPDNNGIVIIGFIKRDFISS
jgi:hypothetical protein